MTEAKTCILCGRDAGTDPIVYQHTPEESEVMSSLEVTATETIYCPACDRIMRDPEQVAQLFKGLELTRCRTLGVPIVLAEQHAQKVYEFYLRHALKKTPS